MKNGTPGARNPFVSWSTRLIGCFWCHITGPFRHDRQHATGFKIKCECISTRWKEWFKRRAKVFIFEEVREVIKVDFRFPLRFRWRHHICFELQVLRFDIFHNHKRIFRGLACFARLLLFSRVVCVVYAKVPWLFLHAKYRARKEKQAAAPFFLRSQHTHNSRKEKPVTQKACSQVLFSFFTSQKPPVQLPLLIY